MASRNVSTIPIASHSSSKSILILLLVADVPTPSVVEVYGDYSKVFHTLFEKAVRGAAESNGDVKTNGETKTITIESYDVVKGEYPSEERIMVANGLVITGSVASAYEPMDWIINLTKFIRGLPESLKVVGICFGHQVVSIAFGGECHRNELGWEIGVRELVLTDLGCRIFGGTSLNVQQMHRDIVPTVPQGFNLTASTSICTNQGFVRLAPSASSSATISPKDISILTFQGHPEFTSGLVNKNLDGKLEKGTISPELVEESRVAANKEDDGVRIGKLILEMMGY